MKYLVGPLRRGASSILVAWFLLLSLAPVVFAQQESGGGGGVKINSIEIQYNGPETVSKERILAQMRTKVGQVYSDGVVEQDIRALYATNQVQNVRIFGQSQGDGVKVIVAIQTRAIVNEIEIEGATKISAKSLRKKIDLKINTPLNEDALGKAKQDILDAYKGKGFNDIDVQYRIDTNEARGTSRVVYTINEGEKGAISNIHFEGNTVFKESVLRKQMKTKGRSPIYFIDKSGRLDEAQLKQDVDAVREWYQNHGYIDVEIKEVRKDRTKGRMNLVIPVVEGQKYQVGRVSVKGFKVTTAEKLHRLMKVKEGDVYSPKAIRDDAKMVADAYGDEGYVDLVITPQGVPHGGNIIDLNYTIEEGDRSAVQRINIVGNIRTKDKVIRREVLIAPGDIYSTTRVEITKKRLDNLGYFSRVETYPDDTGVPGRKDLVVQVEEKRTGSLNFGAGFSTVDNVLGFVELTQGNFDITNWPNFTGGGQKFRMRIQYGAQRKDLILALTEPYFLDRRLSVGGQLFFSEANFLSSVYDQRNYGFSLTARKSLGRFLSTSFEYRLENVEIYNVPVSASPQIRAAAGTDTKSQITPSLIYDTRDNPLLSHRGHRLTLTPFISGGFLGGDVQNVGFDFEASQYFPLPWLDMILLFNGQLASVDAWGDGVGVPLYDRLYLGGPNNLRGFDFRDVGPKDRNGEPIGGRSLGRTTVELTARIMDKVRGAVFYDLGVVEEKAWDLGGRAASDVGVGLRLDLPVGPLRLDYGYPVTTGGNNKREGKFNFAVGYQF